MYNNLNSDKHQFALFYENLSVSNKDPKELYVINKKSEKDLYNRIVNVLRLKVDESVIFFNRHYRVVAELTSITKKQVSFSIVEGPVESASVSPRIVYGLPVLRKSQLESALYSLAEVGAQEIQLLSTDKAYNVNINMDRLEKILIAACEQAKNYSIPLLHKPIDILSWLKSLSASYGESNKKILSKIFFDAQGCSSFDIVCNLNDLLKKQKSSNNSLQYLILLSGPEADLSVEEKKEVLSYDFVLCQLTSTILRAQQAVALGAGLIKSLIKVEN